MAPMDHIKKDVLDDLKERDDLTKTLLRKRGGGGGNGEGSSNSYPDYNPPGNNDSSGKSNDSGKNGNGDNNPGKDHTPPSPSYPPSSFLIKSTSAAQTTSIAVATVPPTAVIASTTPESSSSTSISSSIPTLSTTTDSISSPPTMTSMLPSITAYTSLADTSSQPRKGLNTDGDEPFTSSTSISTSTKTKSKSTATAATAFAETAPASTTSLDMPAQQSNHHGSDKHDGLSPTAEHVLIAFGTIGAFIIFVAVVYFIARMRKIDLISKVRSREFRRGGSRGWYGWREREMDYATDVPPPKYSGYDESIEYPSEQKAVPAQRQLNAFFSPTTTPTLATPESAAGLSRADPQRQETVREALLDNPAPFGVSPAQPAQPTEHSAAQVFNNQPSYDPNPTYNPNLTYNTMTTAGGLSRQTSDANDPAQREVTHMSYLSSLSSGFGDQIIIPEPGPMKPNNVRASRQSYRQSRKFSWATSARGPQGDRDTVYTTSSIDSQPPRFRTINSWVAQQTGRLQKQNLSKDEVPTMPEIPKPLQVGVGVDHQRKSSEDPAFRHHPGDEIELGRASRIPSTILDKKFGIN